MRLLKSVFFCSLFFVALISQGASLKYNTGSSSEDKLLAQSTLLRPAVLENALHAYASAIKKHVPVTHHHLTIIDYSLPSTVKRLWVIDMDHLRIDQQLLVTHAVNSGDVYAVRFSNQDDSHESSLGLFLTEGAYSGNDGYSLVLNGLEPGFNDHAKRRYVVVHSGWYANQSTIMKYGRLGRSWGCPVVDPKKVHALIDEIKDGSLLFVYYPDKKWLNRSRYL